MYIYAHTLAEGPHFAGPSVCGAGPPLSLCGHPPLPGSPSTLWVSPPTGCDSLGIPLFWGSHPLRASLTLWISTSMGPYPLSLPLLQTSLCEPPSLSGSPSLGLPCFWGSLTHWACLSMGWDFLGLPLLWRPPLFWSLILLGTPLVEPPTRPGLH